MELPNHSSKAEPEKSGERAPTKIPPVTRASSISVRPVASRITRNITSLSKIPKRDIGMLKRATAPEHKPTPRVGKQMDNKKSSKSSVSLGVARTPRQSSIISTRSNMLQKPMKSRDPTPRANSSNQAAEKHKNAAERMVAKKNIIAFENMKEKIKTCQSEFMRKWELVKDTLPPEEGEYKLISLMKNNDGQLLTKTPQKIKVKCASKNLDDFKKDMQSYVQNNLGLMIESLDQLKTAPSKIGDNPSKGIDCLSVIEDVKKKIKINHVNTLTDILKQIETLETETKPLSAPSLQTIDSNMNFELETKMNKLMKEVDELKTNLEQSQKELSRIKKSNEDKDVMHKKELEEKEKKLFKKQQELDELKRKHDNAEKDHSKEKTSNKDLVEKLSSKTVELDELKKKLKALAHSNSAQQAKNQEHETRIKILEEDLKAATRDVEKRSRLESSIGDQALKQADEIKALKTDIVNTKKEKERMEKEIQILKKEAEDKIYFEKKNKHAEAEIQSLRQCVRDLENQIQETKALSPHTRDYQDELARLQKSESDKAQKIEVLEMELTKAHFQIQKLEEKIVMDRKLLKVRCSLIESLQTKENTQKTHLEDLFAEVGERNNDIQMLKSELITKNEEFQSLFATLSAKQLELTRQEHMIKLLQESNERAQTLRVKQEAKIGRLEEEIAQLKQTISLYQDAVLPNNALRKNLLMAESSRENDINDTMGYYVDERRRKRHIDINVKKYEK